MKARALFLDRDGVINVDHGYVYRAEDFELLPGIVRLLRTARSLGFLLIAVTNQSGLARGMFGDDDYRAIERHMRAVLTAQGAALTDVYHCPHHPDGIVPELAVPCNCRKPNPGMILQAAADHDIDLSRSIMIGDKESDVEAARTAGIGTSFLVQPATIAADFARIEAALHQT